MPLARIAGSTSGSVVLPSIVPLRCHGDDVVDGARRLATVGARVLQQDAYPGRRLPVFSTQPAEPLLLGDLSHVPLPPSLARRKRLLTVRLLPPTSGDAACFGMFLARRLPDGVDVVRVISTALFLSLQDPFSVRQVVHPAACLALAVDSSTSRFVRMPPPTGLHRPHRSMSGRAARPRPARLRRCSG